MNLLDYIKGKRKGIDANRIEKDSMKDPFLYEAIEGFDSINDDHVARIDKIKELINVKPAKAERRSIVWQTVAASLILTLGIGGYFLIDGHKSDLYAQEADVEGIIKIYVPEQFYAENIAIIAQKNTILVRSYKPDISRFNINEDISSDVTQDELSVLAGNTLANNESIDIYMPSSEDKESKNTNRYNGSSQSDKLFAQQSAASTAIANADEMIADVMITADSNDNLIAEAAIARQEPTRTYASQTIAKAINKDEVEVVAKQSSSSVRAETRLRNFQATQAAKGLGGSSSEVQPVIGYEQYNAYLKSELIRPTDEACKDKKGDVVVEFSINEEGQPYQFEIKQSLCDASDKEAIRLIRSGSKWTPTSQRIMIKVAF